MIYEDAHYYSQDSAVEYQETQDHELLLSQLKNVATNQEATIYALFSLNWKAQLDPQLRQWMMNVRTKYLETKKQCNSQKKGVLNSQFETLSNDNQTADVQLNHYFQL